MTTLVYDNIFDAVTNDAGEAADLQFRADLMITLRQIFENRGWKQAAIATVLGVPQPRVSELLNGKIHLFSADKLIGFLARLDVRLRPSFNEDHRVVCDVLQPA